MQLKRSLYCTVVIGALIIYGCTAGGNRGVTDTSAHAGNHALPRAESPAVAQTPLSGPAGTLFTQWGTGFTPHGLAILHFRKPDGTEYPTQSHAIDAKGAFSISYTSRTSKHSGTYTWWAVDESTGKASNAVRYTID